MGKRRFVTVAMMFSLVALASTSTHEQRPLVPPSARCRHDGSELQPDRVRREAAVALARAINAVEGEQAQLTRRYQPLAALRGLPETPAGFELRFYSDAAGYMFALKDTLDSCRYAIFSDQSGLLYEKSARAAPQVAH